MTFSLSRVGGTAGNSADDLPLFFKKKKKGVLLNGGVLGR